MSTTIQLVKNEKPIPALFIEKDLHLNKLIAATVASVNLWSKIQDGSDKNPFELCIRKVLNDFGGTLFGQYPVEAVYQINYKEDTENSDLKIESFIYWNKYLQCKAFGDVYGFASYNKLGIEAMMPNKFYKFDRSFGPDGKLTNPKQYNIMLELDDVDKHQMEHQDALVEEKKEEKVETPETSAEPKTKQNGE